MADECTILWVLFLEGTGIFHFFALMHSFQKLVSDFGDFETLRVIREKDIENALHGNECE